MDVKIELDKMRTLRFDINALCSLEDHFGGTPVQDLLRFRLGIKMLRGLVWAGLLHEEPTMTPGMAGVLLQQFIDREGSHLRLTAAMTEALRTSGILKEKDDKDEKKPGNAEGQLAT